MGSSSKYPVLRACTRALIKTLVFVLSFIFLQTGFAQGRWIGTTDGCVVWNAEPQPNETATWNGPCVYNRANGYGVLIWESVKDGVKLTSRYEGRMRNGKRHGQGLYVRANGARYEGSFKDGRRHGRGVYTDPEGNRYEGEVRDGKPNGFGILLYADGGRYEGNWQDGNPHGHGVFDFKDTTRFEGEFVNGTPQGVGECRALDGKEGKCEFRDGKFAGWR